MPIPIIDTMDKRKQNRLIIFLFVFCLLMWLEITKISMFAPTVESYYKLQEKANYEKYMKIDTNETLIKISEAKAEIANSKYFDWIEVLILVNVVIYAVFEKMKKDKKNEIQPMLNLAGKY